MDETGKSKKGLAIGVALGVVIVVLGSFYAPKLIGGYYLERGISALDKGDFQKALPLFEFSTKWAPGNPVPQAYLGEVELGPATPGADDYYANANYQAAIQHFESAKSKGLESSNAGFYSKVLNDLGYSYWAIGEYQKADKNFVERIALSPNNSFASRYLLALDDFERFNKPEEAISALPPAIDVAQLDFQKNSIHRIYLLLAKLYSYYGDHENAIKYARLTITSAPQDNAGNLDIQSAHIWLAVELSKTNNINVALAEIKKAKSQQAGGALDVDSQYQCSIASLYYDSGNLNNAVSISQQGLSNRVDKDVFNSRDALCLRVLADSYLAMKKSDEAKKYMQQYLVVTEKISDKDIFVMRNRENFQKLLNGL